MTPQTVSTTEERVIDEYLRSQGHAVTENPQQGVQGAGRQGDRYVDGVKTEYKTLAGVQDQSADSLSGALASRVMDGRGQADHLIVDTRGQPGMTRVIAERGISRA